VSTNLVANGAGSVLTSLIQFAIIPVYIRLLGPEAFGLIGVQVTLQSLAQLLDLGVSASVNRELARRTALGEPAQRTRDMVRTLEVAYAAIGLLIGGLVYLAAPLAERWLNHAQLSDAMVRRSIQAMALVLGAQWPLTFYQGALLGLQRHALFNSVRVGVTALTAVGSYVVLTRVSATPTALFLWQAFMAIAHVILLAAATWRRLPRGTAPSRVRRSAVTGLWRFAAGVAGVTATALFLSQIDRIVVSRLLSLEIFGYYMLAATVANALLYTFVSPAYTSVFPRLSSLVALGNASVVRRAYRRAWGLMTVLAVPAASVLVVFAEPLLLAWTGNRVAAHAAAPLTMLLVSGMALNGLLLMPLSLQLAHGWPSIALRTNLLLCIIALPSVLFMTHAYGSMGAAATWPFINVLYACISLTVTQDWLGDEAGIRWLGVDIIVPALVAVAGVIAVRFLVPSFSGLIATLAVAASAWILSTGLLVAASPLLLGSAKDLLAQVSNRRAE
jgi:O-antigen/teichoic acid export membrane protein